MTEFLYEYGLFLLKAITVLLVLAAVITMIAAAGVRSRRGDTQGKLRVVKLNEQLENLENSLAASVLEPAARKQELKAKKAAQKARRKVEKQARKRARRQRGDGETRIVEQSPKRVFVLDFNGDLRASGVERLRREISAILTTATPEDEVVVRLESGGGLVTSYGLGASQLDRLREHRIPLTVCVDKIAASGGYMMACVGNRLIAAPFAVVGSIGVVAQIPNFHRLLKQLNIDFELLTAGKFKRTLTLFGENTDEGRQKFLEDIERIHAQFKQYVDRHRPKLDIDRVSTGEFWSGQDALELKLVDQLSTSDEYLITACRKASVLHLQYREKKHWFDRFGIGVEKLLDGVLLRWIDRLLKSRYSIG